MSISQLQHLESRTDESETLVFSESLRPYVTVLRDVGAYEPVPPTKRKAILKKTVKRVPLDVKKMAKQAKEERMEELVSQATRLLDEPNKPRHRRARHIEDREQAQPSTEDLIRHIDERIAELEAEERAKDAQVIEDVAPRD
jgi:hypothetical protein